MPPIDLYLGFIAATVILMLIPGPSGTWTPRNRRTKRLTLV